VSAGPGGSIYVTDTSATVRQFSRASGTEKVIAGVAAYGFSGDGGPAVKAQLRMGVGSYLGSAVPDRNGNLIIADASNNRLRAVAARNGTYYGVHMLRGHIYTIVGNGAPAFKGDGGPARKAEFDSAGKIAFDPAGNLVLPDIFNSRVRVVAAKTGTFWGKHMVAGDIYTVAGKGGAGPLGNGGPASKATLADPTAVATDHAGNLVIADAFHYRVRVVAAKTGTFYGKHMVAGDIYLIAGNGRNTYSGDGRLATSAGLGRPIGVTVDKSGNVAIAAWHVPRVRMVAVKTGTFWGKHMVAGHIYTIAGGTSGSSGNGGPAAKAGLNTPEDVAADATGNLLIADTGNNLVRVVAARNGTFYGVAMKAAHIYTVAGNGKRSESGDRGPALNAELSRPEGVAVSDDGNIAVADAAGNRVRLAAATSGTFFGQKMVAGDIYTVAGDGEPTFSGDGGLATATTVWAPEGAALDHSGNLVIADTSNCRVRVVAARSGTFYGQKMVTGHIYTIAGDGDRDTTGDGGPATAAGVRSPSNVTVDAAGNVLLSEDSPVVRVVAVKTGTFYGQAMAAGDIYTIAGDGTSGFGGDGGPATSAELGSVFGLTTDRSGNVVISDTANERIRVVAVASGTFYGQAMVAGDIYTIAGNGTRGFSGDGKPATSAKLSDPEGIAFDHAGNLLIADTNNNRVRMVAATAGTFYGAARTAGHIYTIAGTGGFGFSGDGGPATSATLLPLGLATGPGGEVLFSDGSCNRIRVLN
jgi:uncharacterized protein YheU (UPF0270 family)